MVLTFAPVFVVVEVTDVAVFFSGDFVAVPLLDAADVRDTVDVRLALLGVLDWAAAIVRGAVVVGDFLVITGFSLMPFVVVGFRPKVTVVSITSLRIPFELLLLLLPSLTGGPITLVLSRLKEENPLGKVSLSKLSIESNSSPNRFPFEANGLEFEWELFNVDVVFCLVVVTTVRRVELVVALPPPVRRRAGFCCVFVIVVVVVVVVIGFNG